MIAAATTALLLAYTPSLHPPAIRAARCAPPTLQLDALGDAVKKASSVAGDVAKAAGVDKALENVGSAVGDVAKSASSAVGGKVMEQMRIQLEAQRKADEAKKKAEAKEAGEKAAARVEPNGAPFSCSISKLNIQ